MAKEEREEDSPLTIAEEWRASLVGLQLQFQKQMLHGDVHAHRRPFGVDA
jgi:hypothetical protein